MIIRQITRRLAAPLGRFIGDTAATLALEAVIVVPFLVWCYLGLFTMYDGFRHLNANTSSASTLSDLLSRETGHVTADYLDGMNEVHAMMTAADGATNLRVTVVRYDEPSRELILDWSHATGAVTPHDSASLATVAAHIPDLSDAETVIVLEAWMPFEPMTGIFLEPFAFHALTVTRPRFAPQLRWQD